MRKQSINLGVRVDYELDEQIRQQAKLEGRSISWVIRDLIKEGIKARNKLSEK